MDWNVLVYGFQGYVLCILPKKILGRNLLLEIPVHDSLLPSNVQAKFHLAFTKGMCVDFASEVFRLLWLQPMDENLYKENF